MEEGIMDIVVVVVVLAVVISISMGLIVPLVRASLEDLNNISYNKTVYKSEGETGVGYGDYDGTMSKSEVILATQVMDWGCPEPRVLKVDDLTINITSTYRTELLAYANLLWGKIGTDADTTRYKYEYNFGNDKINGDESYTIERK